MPPSLRRTSLWISNFLDRDGAYAFVARTLKRLGYGTLDKPSKALLKRYLAKTTGYSRPAHAARPPAPRDREGGRPPGRELGPARRAGLAL